LQHHESGQILGLRANAVRHPSADAGASGAHRARVHEQLRRAVIEVVGRDALEEREIVRHGAEMRQQLAQILAGFSVLLELARLAQKLGRLLRKRVHEGKALALHEGLGHGLLVKLRQFRFVVEQLELAGTAALEKVDDVVDLRGMMQRLH
jgi:hypothetical protein